MTSKQGGKFVAAEDLKFVPDLPTAPRPTAKMLSASVVRQLRRHPFEWAMVREDVSTSSGASTRKTHHRHGFTDLDFRVRTSVGGKRGDLWASSDGSKS